MSAVERSGRLQDPATVLRWLRRLQGAFKQRLKRYPVITNANAADESKLEKRALLVYIVKPFLLRPGDERGLTHQNVRQCKQIAALLHELGYVVDVVDIRDRSFKPSRAYNLLISNRLELKWLESHFLKGAIRIFLATTLSNQLHNRNSRRRHELLAKRRGCELKVRRIYPERLSYLAHAHAIVAFGNELVASSWRQVFSGPVYVFNNYGFSETKPPSESKDFLDARTRFLYFASQSQVQKGLDLLLEIFPGHPNLQLYVCSNFRSEPDFVACYHKELYQTPNVHPVGWIMVNSPEFNELMQKCACVIHPTCSDGQAGSVVQCMYAGLIPLVTAESGIDIREAGIVLPGEDIEDIERVILDVSQRPASWHQEQSRRTRKLAEEKYSESAFIDRWREMLTEILDAAEGEKTIRKR